jgi:hypothetical protein
VATPSARRIVFVDGNAPDLQTLLDGVGPDATAFVLDPDQDGLQQIVAIPAANQTVVPTRPQGLQGVPIVTQGSAEKQRDTVPEPEPAIAAEAAR